MGYMIHVFMGAFLELCSQMHGNENNWTLSPLTCSTLMTRWSNLLIMFVVDM
jgi:hypothetical protein